MDDRIDEWHEGDDPRPLHEYLGLTWEQYAAWAEGVKAGEIEVPELLPCIFEVKLSDPRLARAGDMLRVESIDKAGRAIVMRMGNDATTPPQGAPQ